MYKPKHLKRWTMPECYVGAVWPSYYSSGVGQSRDSDALERSNFICMLERLGGESETVKVVRESHWAVGWVEWIAIYFDDEKSLKIADEIKGKLEDYPIVDEEHWSELEDEEAANYWNSFSPREKVEWALDERKRYHWLSKEPVWRYGRWNYDTLASSDSEIARALVEHLKTA